MEKKKLSDECINFINIYNFSLIFFSYYKRFNVSLKLDYCSHF